MNHSTVRLWAVVLGLGLGLQAGVALARVTPQSKCLLSLHKAGDNVAANQGMTGIACLREAVRQIDAEAQACLVGDAFGRVANAAGRTTKAATKYCAAGVDFGQADPAVVNNAASSEGAALFNDIFGPDLGVAVSQVAHVPGMGNCQVALAMSFDEISIAVRRQFLKCAGDGLRDGSITSTAGLEACFEAFAGDDKARIARAKARLQSSVMSQCAGLDLAMAAPGRCAAAANLSDCIAERIVCRVCRTFNAADALAGDCDVVDDGVDNASCP